jgi:hypothetical protein
MTIRKVIEWSAIFGTLGAFTLWTTAAYAQPSNKFLETQLVSYHGHGKLIYFEDEHGHFDRDEYVCSITQNKLSKLQSAYTVKLEQRKEHGHTYIVAIVVIGKHQDSKHLKAIVGKDLASDCKHHDEHSLFYFFTVPSLS